MPDVVYEWLERFQMFMDRGSFADALFGLALAAAFAPLLVLVHEAGHAVAVRLRGLPLHGLSIGSDPILGLTVGGFRLELGRFTGKGDVGGYVAYDGRRATPVDALVIALAGPAANLVAAVVTGWLVLTGWPEKGVTFVLATLTVGGIWMALANLRLGGEAQDPRTWSDGAWVRVAWRGIRAGVGGAPMWRDPADAVSVPPPHAPS